MDDLRAVVAMFISCVSAFLVYDLLANGFSWSVLYAAVLGFLAVHYIWPRKTNDESAWYELLEFVFDLPYRCIALLFRGLGRAVKGGDGLDIDL